MFSKTQSAFILLRHALVVALAAIGFLTLTAHADPNALASDPTQQRVDSLLAKLTIDQKLSLMHTQGFLETIPVTGFPPSTLNDGPMGVRRTTATAFPSPICMGATWDRQLLFQMSAAMGQEAKTFENTLVQLGPMINLIRHPNGGRNFEMFGEDPFLVGSLAIPYVQGLQSEKVAACPKHIACNEQETDRKGLDVQIDDRVLHEVYLSPFEMVVKQADPWFIMTAYNKINGVDCYRNRHLLQDIVRGQWHYPGAFCSDWTAVQDAKAAVDAGLNFDLNSAMAYTTQLPTLVKNGTISESKIDELLRPILRAYILSGLLDGDRPGSINTSQHQQIARQVAEEGIVLLKNNGVLPLDLTKIHRVAVFGPDADTSNCNAGGSGAVHPPYEITPLQGIRRLCGQNAEVVVQPFQAAAIPIPASAFSHQSSGESPQGIVGQYFNDAAQRRTGKPAMTRIDSQLNFNWIDNSPAQGEVNPAAFTVSWTGQLTAPADGAYYLLVSAKGNYTVSLDGKKIISTFPADHCDRNSAQVRLNRGMPVPLSIDFYKNKSDASFTLNWRVPTLADDASELAASVDVAVVVIGTNHQYEAEGADRPFWQLPPGQADLIRTVSQANPKTVVVMVGGSPLEIASWQGNAPALVEMWYAGMEGGDALADILFGRVNPSGKLPVTIPRNIEDVGSNGHFATNKTVDLPEGVFVGYRHFDKQNIEPLYPFGFGLSYTTFTYNQLIVHPAEQGVAASFQVANTGAMAGTEITEAYVGGGPASVEMPVRELQGFDRINLEPGETRTVTLHLPPRAFAYYDTTTNAWHVAAGNYTVEIGSSSRLLPLKATVTMPDIVLK